LSNIYETYSEKLERFNIPWLQLKRNERERSGSDGQVKETYQKHKELIMITSILNSFPSTVLWRAAGMINHGRWMTK